VIPRIKQGFGFWVLTKGLITQYKKTDTEISIGLKAFYFF